MNLRIFFKFKDCKLQFYEKRRLFCYFGVNPCMPASRWRRLLKLKQKKTLLRLSLASLSPHYYSKQQRSPFRFSPKIIKCTQKPKIEKKFTGIDQSSERASERIYNSLLRMRAIHKLKMVVIFNLPNSHLLTFSLPTEEVSQVNGQNRPVANLPVVDFHS